MAERGLHRGQDNWHDKARSNWSGVAYHSGRTGHLDPMEKGDLTPDWDEINLSLDNMDGREEDGVQRRSGVAADDDSVREYDAGEERRESDAGLSAEMDDYRNGGTGQITRPKELAPQSTKMNEIQSPVVNTGENISGSQVKVDTAGASGIFSDQVLTGSPAQEYGAQGRYALDGMIEASERIAREKYRAAHDERD